MKYLLILITTVVSVSVYAQNCDESTLDQIPGKWSTGSGSVGLSGAELTKAKGITNNLDNHFRANFPAFKGLHAEYFSAFLGFNQYNGNDLAEYYYRLYFCGFYCYNNEVHANPDRFVAMEIKLNETGLYFTREVLPGEWQENEKDHFGWIDNFPDQKEGLIYMKATPDSAQFTAQPERWLITYGGKLPYTYVTRAEYLQALNSKLFKAKKKGMDDLKSSYQIRPKAEQIKEKEEMLKKFKEEAANGLGDWTDRYLQNYRTDEQILDEHTKMSLETYNKPLQVVDDLLKMSESELQKTAIVSTISEFNGFVEEGDIGAVIVIKENPAYYNENLSKSVPQVIYVTLDINSKDEKYVSAYDTILKLLDFQMLKNLLGK